MINCITVNFQSSDVDTGCYAVAIVTHVQPGHVPCVHLQGKTKGHQF